MRPVLWITLLAFVVLIMGLLAYLAGALAGGADKAAAPDTPAGRAFAAANERIGKPDGAYAFGNDPEAVALAKAYSVHFKAAAEATFGGESGPASFARGVFLTHCERRGDSVAFLVHVPELRRYKGDTRDALAEIAWRAACETLRANGVDRPTRLAVALRGELLYGPVMAGEFDPEPMNPPRPTFNGSGADGLTRVYPFFETPTTATATMPASGPATMPE